MSKVMLFAKMTASTRMKMDVMSDMQKTLNQHQCYIKKGVLMALAEGAKEMVEKPLKEEIGVLKSLLGMIHASHKEAVRSGNATANIVEQLTEIENVLRPEEKVAVAEEGETIEEPSLEYWRDLALDSVMISNELRNHLRRVLELPSIVSVVYTCRVHQDYRSGEFTTIDEADRYLANIS